MSTASGAQKKWLQRLRQLALTSTWISVSFTLGSLITAYIAVRLLFPLAITGMAMGMLGMAWSSAQASISALYSGDSTTRLAVLNELKVACDSQPAMTFDAPTAAWLLPAIEQCQTDADPEVVAIAVQLASYIRLKTPPTSQ